MPLIASYPSAARGLVKRARRRAHLLQCTPALEQGAGACHCLRAFPGRLRSCDRSGRCFNRARRQPAGRPAGVDVTAVPVASALLQFPPAAGLHADHQCGRSGHAHHGDCRADRAAGMIPVPSGMGIWLASGVTDKMNDLDPQAWLADVLADISPGCGDV